LESAVFYRLAQILDLLKASGFPTRRIIVSGGILRSIAAVRLLADAIGRDVEISRVREASLRGAALFALQHQRIRPSKTPKGRVVKHSRVLAALHAERRAQQENLENRLTAGSSG
jgi:sugar (pentulose or hexulose) kinase